MARKRTIGVSVTVLNLKSRQDFAARETLLQITGPGLRKSQFIYSVFFIYQTLMGNNLFLKSLHIVNRAEWL